MLVSFTNDNILGDVIGAGEAKENNFQMKTILFLFIFTITLLRIS
jgi:hypothetical protein